MTKAYIIAYNRLTYIKNMADWCAAHGLEPIIVDNCSDYPPLLEYYKNDCPYHVERLVLNYGHKVMQFAGLSQVIQDRYIITDPDLDLSGVPDDFLDVLNAGLDQFPKLSKVGFSLEINDLPDTKEGEFVRKVESRYWNTKIGNWWMAPIDTTFALYSPEHKYIIEGMRADRPYTARHLTWYYPEDISLLPEDEQYYFRTADIRSASGKKRMKI